MKLFIYDNLKTGGVWNCLLKSASLLGITHTISKYPLVVKNELPYLLNEDAGRLVWGEVYDVDDKTLKAIDAIMENPLWYQRLKCEVLINGRICEVWAYFLNKSRYQILDNWKKMPFYSVFSLDKSL